MVRRTREVNSGRKGDSNFAFCRLMKVTVKDKLLRIVVDSARSTVSVSEETSKVKEEQQKREETFGVLQVSQARTHCKAVYGGWDSVFVRR